jgi:hypothetical protein
MADENAAIMVLGITTRMRHDRWSQFQGPLATCRRRNRWMIATCVNFTSLAQGCQLCCLNVWNNSYIKIRSLTDKHDHYCHYKTFHYLSYTELVQTPSLNNGCFTHFEDTAFNRTYHVHRRLSVVIFIQINLVCMSNCDKTNIFLIVVFIISL